MKKNVAGQTIGAEIITAADGTAFTGSVTASVTGDNGTQATGSVGAGACTHKGNGYHSYGPALEETDHNHVAFTFTGTGAIPVTVQVYPSFPQTGNSFTRLAAPAGASVSADIAALKAETAAILADTGTDGVVVAAASKTGYTLSSAGIQAVWDALTSALTTVGSVGKLIVDNVNATISSRMATTHIAATAGKVDGVALVDTTTTNTDMRGTDSANTTTPPTAGAIADAVLDEALSEPSATFTWAGATLRTVVSWIGALSRNKVTQTATTQALRNDADAGNVSTSTVSDDGTTFTRGEWS